MGQADTCHRSVSPHSPRPHVSVGGKSGLCKAYINGEIKILLFSSENPIPLTFSILFSFFDSSTQMQSWLGTFNPERERRKVMNELLRRCISQCTRTHAPAHTWTRRGGHTVLGIRVCAGLTPSVALHVCETARSNLTLPLLCFLTLASAPERECAFSTSACVYVRTLVPLSPASIFFLFTLNNCLFFIQTPLFCQFHLTIFFKH